MIDIQAWMSLYEPAVFLQTAGQQTVVVAHADDVIAGSVAEADVPVVYHVDGTAVLLVTVVADAAVVEVGLDDGS